MQQMEGQFYLTSDEAPQLLDQMTRPNTAETQTGEIGITSEHNEAEQVARENEARLRSVLANMPAILYTIDRTGIITLLEGKGAGALENATGEAVITSVFDLYRDVPQTLQIVRRAFEGESFTTLSEVDGHTFESRFMPVRDQNNDVTSVVCLAIDVTERIQIEKIVQAREKQVEEALRESEERLRTVVSNAPIVLFAFDSSGIFTLSEGRGLQSLGLRPGQVVGLSVFDVYHDLPQMLDEIRRALTGETLTVTNQIGNLFFESQLTPLYDKGRGQVGVIAVATDITERVRAVDALQESERRFRALIEQASDLVLILDASGKFRYVSPSHQRIMGYAPEELINKSVFKLIHPADRPQAQAKFSAALQVSGMVVRTECRLLHANGSWVTLECVGRSCFDDPTIKGFIINARDISERIAMEERLRHHMLYDSLTDLPNRILLQERLEQALLIAKHAGNDMALLMMDLDRFREINDTFGHQNGDILLQEVGARLRKAVSDSDVVARLGGDEFAILLQTADETRAIRVVSELRAVLDEPFMIVGYPLQVEASVGVVLYPAHGSDARTLMRRADMAMFTAKRTHEGYVLYDANQDDQSSSRRLSLIGALRQAIAADELMLYYQPKVDLRTGIPSSVEALLRWQHPTYGFIPPDQFIPLAEQTGLIASLTHWVLKTAVRQCSAWLHAGLNLSVAVNLSMWNLREAKLPDTIASLLEQYNVPARFLRVELTESSIMADTDLALDVLKRLSALGVRISIDDFGTGYSSLAYLKRLPVDELKIDRSFVQHMATIETDATIVQSTVAMAHGLGLRVVAEGVEDQETWYLLASLNCDKAQGYYMSRPLPAHDLEHWLLETKQAVVY